MMTILYNSVEENKVPFSNLVNVNKFLIKSYMTFENYDLNNTVIPVTELIKDHCVEVLVNSYGNFYVEETILNELLSEVFINFPVLLQQLSITRLIDSYGVVKDDTDTIETTRTETLNTEVDQSSTLTQGTSQNDNNVLNTQQKTTGTVAIDGSSINTQNSTTNIENSSGVESTGTRNVNVSHNMPEQSILGTGDFQTDTQGTPILSSSYVQQAEEGFTTSNPINTNELSEQIISGTNNVTNNSTTTNDVTVSDTGTTNRTITNSGSDSSESTTATTGTNTVVETVNSTTTNKQYAYEIKAFLETASSINAFRRWEDAFSWVVGII